MRRGREEVQEESLERRIGREGRGWGGDEERGEAIGIGPIL